MKTIPSLDDSGRKGHDEGTEQSTEGGVDNARRFRLRSSVAGEEQEVRTTRGRGHEGARKGEMTLPGSGALMGAHRRSGYAARAARAGAPMLAPHSTGAARFGERVVERIALGEAEAVVTCATDGGGEKHVALSWRSPEGSRKRAVLFRCCVWEGLERAEAGNGLEARIKSDGLQKTVT
jgi:hypothetical protein